uniref:IPPc domain-containing protein n=1 Tax=Caenorhabditis tropicalis TaxID=1561998 RepID=A0A1I7T023_9PELO
MVIVFIRKQHIKYAIEPQVSFIYSGSVVKPIRTKGAIAVCFRLYQRFIVLLGCHLTHATPEGRIQDYRKVVNTLRFPQLAKFRADGSSQIFAADVVLWVGDLNFRVTVENDVDWRNPENIQDKIYDEVLKTEELATHKANKAFDGFNEAPIRFPPTHKFDPDSDNYVISTPKRIPSYTDRVLYRTRNESWIQPIKYDCMRGPSPSDHKAVLLTFRESFSLQVFRIRY